MNIFKSKNLSYEELDPRCGQKKLLNYAIIGILTVGILALIVVLIINSRSSDSEIVGPDRDNNINGSDVPVLQASGGNGNYVLRAAGDNTSGSTATEPPEEDVLVDIDQGSLRGKRMTSRGGREYLAFIGIPYAKPPLGELRFQPSVEAEPWEGTLNATTFTPQCIQKDKYNSNSSVYKGSEDCLYLNIYTPKKLEELNGRRQRLPVMVYIHGGNPFGNASRYGGDYLMDQDVILVTFHFRLGALGNLNTNDSVSRGNQGLKDQVMCLQWVKDNIRNFGGDRRKVTLFGNSYGGMAVSTHLLSPMSKRLFHRAIVQSGVAVYPTYIVENPRAIAFELGKKLNCSTSNSTELVNCLRGIDASQIAISSYMLAFSTSIDAPSETGDNDDAILPDYPLTLLQNGEVNRMPVIFGGNSGEGIIFGSLATLLSSNLTEQINQNWTETAVKSLELDLTATEPTVIADAARNFYFGEQNISCATVRNLTNMISDRKIFHPTSVFARFQSQNGNSGRRGRRNRNQVYLYYFDRKVAKKYSAALESLYQPEEFLGASHGDDLQLLFPYDDYPYVSLDSEYANISLTMVSLWTSFASTGTPTGTTKEWLPINSTQNPYRWFQLDDAPKMVDFLGDRMNFWDSFNSSELYTYI